MMNLNLNWSTESVHTDGRFISTASPTPDFWQVWRERKRQVKAAGYSVRKIDDEWIVTRLRDNDQAIAESQAVDADIDIPVPEGLSTTCHTKAGIAYAIQRSSTLIGDEMGLGNDPSHRNHQRSRTENRAGGLPRVAQDQLEK